MPYLILMIVIVLIVFGPKYWVKHVIRKHDTHLDDMPGTGSELALHLIERFNLDGVVVEKTTKDDDFYLPDRKIVGLSPEVYDGKSLSAVAIAAHEVGHAMQHINEEPVSLLRNKYEQLAEKAQDIGIVVLALSPILGLISRAPVLMLVVILAGLTAMLASVALHAMILPEEYDASFSKALPILNDGYVPNEYIPAVRQVLKACSLTYLAGALADILSVWRWISVLR